MKTWLITGCSSGIGRGIAKAVLKKGDNAVVTARDTSKIADLVDYSFRSGSRYYQKREY